MRIPKTCKLPDWFTLEPLEDGSYVAMEDPMVKEMLAVFAERYGNMCCRVFEGGTQNWKGFWPKINILRGTCFIL